MQEGSRPHAEQEQQVVGAADGMEKAGDESAPGEAMGLGRLITKQRQGRGPAEQGQGSGREGRGHRGIRSAPGMGGGLHGERSDGGSRNPPHSGGTAPDSVQDEPSPPRTFLVASRE